MSYEVYECGGCRAWRFVSPEELGAYPLPRCACGSLAWSLRGRLRFGVARSAEEKRSPLLRALSRLLRRLLRVNPG